MLDTLKSSAPWFPSIMAYTSCLSTGSSEIPRPWPVEAAAMDIYLHCLRGKPLHPGFFAQRWGVSESEAIKRMKSGVTVYNAMRRQQQQESR